MKKIFPFTSVGRWIASAAVAIMLPACQLDEEHPLLQEECDSVEVLFKLSAAPQDNGLDGATRGSGITDSDSYRESNDIQNLWVLQFDGTSDDSKMVGSPQYIENYTSSSTIKLISSSNTNRILLIANSFARNIPFAKCNMLAQTKTVYRPISKENDISHSTEESGVVIHYPMMNGYVDLIPDDAPSQGEIPCALYHNAARVDVRITSGANTPQVAIDSIMVRSVPDRLYYITNYSLPDYYPLFDDFMTVDFKPIVWENGTEESDSVRTFSFYVPANKRGSATLSGPTNKGSYAPEKATYIYVMGHYSTDGVTNTLVNYSFYLGNDLSNDYNLLPNGRYQYNLKIKTPGDPSNDFRVEDLGIKDFSSMPLSNCYIINPPTKPESWRNYRIPVKRVNDFWGDNGYENNSLYAIYLDAEGVGWQVDILWSDIPLDDTNFKWVSNKKRTGLDPSTDFFEFSVAEGLSGNIIVGMRRFKSANVNADLDVPILWSWHLWVTDYNPDDADSYSVNPAQGCYSYKVRGGNVHRYNNSLFATGVYKNKVIMDRNLGAKDIYYHGYSSYYDGLFYQFGRKDPFPGPRNIYIRQSDGTFSYTKWSNDKYSIMYNSTGQNDKNVPYSVNNPLVFIKGGWYWTYNDKYNPSTYNDRIIWQDPKAKSDSVKSIFDPCPSGWKVPDKDIWTDFNYSINCVWNNPLATGLNYYPDTYSGNNSASFFYPSAGYINYEGQYSGFSTGYYWSQKPASAYASHHFKFTTTISNTTVRRDYGMSVRCVQE